MYFNFAKFLRLIYRLANPVGGMIVPIDTTALLVAGFENNVISVLGALAISAVAVFGILYYYAKRKN